MLQRSAGVLEKSLSAETLTLTLAGTERKCAIQRSSSFHQQKNSTERTIIPKRSPLVEWGNLCQGLVQAFEESNEVTPHHPAGRCLAAMDAASLARDLLYVGSWQDGAYTRTTVFEGGTFNVQLLCWSPGAMSPVHSHSDASSGVKSNCFVLVLDGELTETVFDPADIDENQGRVTSCGHSRTLGPGSRAYMNDEVGVHKVGNNHAAQKARSLHIYAPGWTACKFYVEEPTDASGAAIDATCFGDF